MEARDDYHHLNSSTIIPTLADVVSFPFIFVALHFAISSLPCPKYLISSLLPLKLLSCFNSLISPPPDLAFCLTKNRGSISREIRCPSPRYLKMFQFRYYNAIFAHSNLKSVSYFSSTKSNVCK